MFWERFCELCDLKSVKPNTVAATLGLSNSVTTSWKQRNSIPSGEILIKLADYFDCSIDFLVGRTDEVEMPAKIEHSQIIFKILEDRNLTPYQVAKETGLSESLFSKWKKNPTSEIASQTLVLIADYLSCSVDYLIGRTDKPAIYR